MIAWGFGIPLFALILLIKDKDRIGTIEVRQRLGFLFNGYQLRYYFWEIIIILRKISLIIIQSFLVQYGVLVQVSHSYLIIDRLSLSSCC